VLPLPSSSPPLVRGGSYAILSAGCTSRKIGPFHSKLALRSCTSARRRAAINTRAVIRSSRPMAKRQLLSLLSFW
jgi:hypothetical protein